MAKKRGLRNNPKKQGMELQVTFLVVMLISIVIFGSGLYLVRKFFTATAAFQEQIDADTQREIERRLSESGEKVSLPINRKQFKVGEERAFGLGIINTLTPDSQCAVAGQQKPCNKFGVMVRFVKAVDSKTQQPIADPADPSSTTFVEAQVIDEGWLPSQFPPVELTPNQMKIVSIPVRVGNVMSSTSTPTRRDTIYIFNVCVFLKPEMMVGQEVNCAEGKTVLLPKLHGNKILKMYVEV